MLPEQYPFAVEHATGLHEVGCSVLLRDMPREFSLPAADDAEALRSFAHHHDAYDFPGRSLAGLEPLRHRVPFQAMTAEETRGWMD